MQTQTKTRAKLLPYPKAHLYPAVLQGILYDFWWDVEKLFLLDLPIETIKIDTLLWHLSLPIWTYDGKQFAISPLEVLDDPLTYSEHYNRTLKADLACPIVIRKDKDKIIVVDGCHRLLRAHMLGAQEMRCGIISKKHERFIARTTASD